MAPHSSTLAWKIPWTEEPGGLQSLGLLRVGHNWATSLSLFTFMPWRRKWQPTPVFLPGESQGRGAWWAAVYGVAQSRTQLKRLSSSSREKQRTSSEMDCASIFFYPSLRIMEIKTKIEKKRDLIKLESYCITEETIKQKDNPQKGRKYFQIM